MTKKIIGFALIVVLVCLFVWRVSAQNRGVEMPTVVMGEAQNPNGSENVFIVAQPEDAPNPLGDPIVGNNQEAKTVINNDIDATGAETKSTENQQPQNAEQAGKDFENTLLEANGRVYDVQSYPEGDLPLMDNSANPDTIYSPNVNP